MVLGYARVSPADENPGQPMDALEHAERLVGISMLSHMPGGPLGKAPRRSADMTRRDKMIQLTSISPVEMVVRRPLRFPVPRIDDAIDKHGFEFFWAQLQVIFDFADPSTFPVLSTKPSGDDLRALERFATKSRDLATSTVLNADGGVSIAIADDGQSEEVTSNLPRPTPSPASRPSFASSTPTSAQASRRSQGS